MWLSPRRLRGFFIVVSYLAMFFCSKVHGMWAGFIVHMGPHFLFGLIVLSKIKLYKSNIVGIICGCICVAVSILCADISRSDLSWYHGLSNWRVFVDARELSLLFLRTGLGISGAVFILWGVDKLVHCRLLMSLIRMISPFGTTTLGIYVIHEWPLMFLHKNYLKSPLEGWLAWPLALILFLGCHYLTLMIRRNLMVSRFFFLDKSFIMRLWEGVISCLNPSKISGH